MNRALTLSVVAVSALGLSACGGSSKPKAAASQCSYTATQANTGSKPAPGLPPQPSGALPTTMTLDLKAAAEGTVTVSLDAKAPCTINALKFLAGKGYFDGTSCHRLTTSGIYVLQCGDPTGSGAGSPGYTMPEENLGITTLPKGTLAMAKTAAPHSSGSQFFICYEDSPLPPEYTPFGTITSGEPVIDAIGAAGSDDSNGPGDGAPKVPVQIVKATIS